MIPEMVREVIALHGMHKLLDMPQRATDTIDSIYYARSYWNDEACEQRAKNRKLVLRYKVS
jgi:hypothetical protein